MSVTLEQIKKLRDATGVSTMACKKALEEANSDQEKAVEILRKKGEAKSQARAERSTSQGAISIAEKSGKTAIINLACETDFVARNEDFVASAKKIAEELLNDENYDPAQTVNDLNFKLGEKIEVKDKKFVEGKVIGTYIHSNNKIGVVVALSEGEVTTAKDIAMHVAAMNPMYINPEEVSEALVSKEKEIWKDQLKKEGKPEQIWDKIMLGKEKKFREENALIKQPFVKNPEITVEKLLGSNKIERFIRLSV